MKKSNFNIAQNFIKLILFFSSYIPLILIIILQLLRVSLEELQYKINIDLKNPSTLINILDLKYINLIIGLFILSILVILILKVVISNTNDPNLKTTLNISNINNINSSYITNYLSIYIFPFITLNMTLLDGIGTAIILIFIIGYVYIKNDILYINPILNIIFKYNIYSAEITHNNHSFDIIFLSKKSRSHLKNNPTIATYKLGYSLFIEI